MDQNNVIDLVIENKQFRSYKLISRGQFSASIEIDNKEKGEKTALLLMTKRESEYRKFEFDKLQSQYTVQALEYEYQCRFQTYLVHTDTGESLRDKIKDKSFQKSPDAIDLICNWIRDASLGLKKIHSNSFVHLNIQSTTIMITTDNRAKIGAFDFARHSSTLNERFEIGSQPIYLPPESCSYDSCATDGEAFDTWCLAILTIEALTNNYIARKTKQDIPWPKLYATLHKILQGSKFKRIVKKAYPKSANEEHLEHVLHLMKHTLKFYTHERPKMSEFSLLMMELGFLKYIDKKLIEEHIWIKKVPLNELEVKMLNMALKKKPSCASQQTENKFGDGFQDQMLFNERYEAENVHYSHPRSQTTLSNRKQSIAVENKYKTKEKQFVLPDDAVSSKKFPENVTVKKHESHFPKKSEKHSNDRMSGDFVSDEFDGKREETEEFSFEHTGLCDSQDSSSGKEILKSEGIQINKPDPYEKPTSKNDLNQSTVEEKKVSRHEKQPEILATDLANHNIHIDKEQDDAVTSKTEKYLNEIHKENTSGTYTSKWIWSKMVNWALEDIFYTGVMQSGSFISKLSKDLTG